MRNYDDFMDGLETAIENSLSLDDEGDVTLNVSNVAECVVDYLEQQGIVNFYCEN